MTKKTIPLFILTNAILAIPSMATTLATPHGDLFSHFWGMAETIHKIETKAYRPIPLATIIEEGLRAMVSKVDAHSSFFSPRSYQIGRAHV